MKGHDEKPIELGTCSETNGDRSHKFSDRCVGWKPVEAAPLPKEAAQRGIPTFVESGAQGQTMRLSEAIRLGSMLGPQCFGIYRDGDARCATAAAADAVNGVDECLLGHHWKWLGTIMVTCPERCHPGKHTVTWMMACHLNDYHRWTREQIADWVATIEPAEPYQEQASKRGGRYL